jgi:hypothetical protein
MRWRPRRRKPSAWASSPDAYTTPGCVGPIVVLVVCIVAIAFLWVAYGWALGELSGAGVPVPDPGNGVP